VGDAAEAYRAALPAGELVEFAVTPLDRVGVPVWSATLVGAPSFAGTGYGGSDAEARAGTYGELTEEWRSYAALHGRPRRQASYAELVRERGADRVQDPRTLALPAGADWTPDRPLQWLPTTRRRDGAQVLVPAEFVASVPHDLPGDPPPGGWLTVPVTNGIGAGLDPDRALAHALLEVVQRDGDGLTFRALDTGVVVDLAGLTDPVALAALDRLRAAGVDVLVKLAAADLGIPVVQAVGAAPGDGVLAATAAGEAADPDPERAVRKAVLEFAAARARKLLTHGPLDAVAAVAPAGYLDRVLPTVDLAAQEPRVLAAMVDWLRGGLPSVRAELDATVFARRSAVALADLPASTRPVTDLLAGFDVLTCDLSGAGVHAVKAVVPSLEVETVAYGRIGERGVRRLRELGRDDLVAVGAGRPGAARVHLTPAAQERLGGPAWLDRAAVDRAVGRLLPLYREPGRHAAQLALASAR
jgi:ribosomal protein S12 methylthiotransferase accessory factor